MNLETSKGFDIFIIVLIFNLIVFSILYSLGIVAYLSTTLYLSYYFLAIKYELITILVLLAIRIFSNGNGVLLVQSSKSLGTITIAVLVIEIALNWRGYFSGYSDNYHVGSVLFEIGCLLASFMILSKPKFLSFETMLVFLLVILIALGSGKRLGLSYIFMAYLWRQFQLRWGYIRIITFIILFTSIGYLWSVWRDDFSLSGISEIFLNSNHGGTLHSAAVYLRALNEGYFSVWDRLVLIVSTFLLSFFVPISYMPAIADLKTYILSFDSIQGNGGLIGSYVVLYFGKVGYLCILFMHRFFIKMNWLKVILFLLTYRISMYNWIPSFRLVSYIVFLLLIFRFLFNHNLITIRNYEINSRTLRNRE